MRAALITIMVWSRIAAADEFFDLERAPVGILNDHVRLRLPKAMALGKTGEPGLLDYGTARLTMKMSSVTLDESLALCVAAGRDIKSRGTTRATTERLTLSAPLDGCAVTPPPPRHDDDLLFAAYIASPDGVDLITFYIDNGGDKDRATWLTLARRIAATATAPTHQLGELTITGGKVEKTKRGWLVSLRSGWCRLSGDDEHTQANSKSVGSAGEWMLWQDALGHDAVATRTIENLHADCHSNNDRALARIRAVVESLHR